MKRPIQALVSALVFMLCLSTSFSTQAVERDSSAVQAIQAYYSEIYRSDSTTSSLDKPERIYAEPLLQLILQEQKKQATSGELGQLSADPLCSCQDPSAVEVRNIRSMPSRKKIQRIQVELNVSGHTEFITLQVVKLFRIWKVRDVSTQDIPSLKQSLLAGQNAQVNQTP
ncbi:hypothetical protein NQT62_15225 [Limnobacter humi]|uniref:DUF3828 domain-containing protein n=1 Tax=Limnobacter humi TaxID=1778671 RepID=A0ABT1WJW3_9BURK|nr:hypothetical protein [Limnobacter humi]MCQ8897792.1 hypothetical protein [Limnobacter humi]